ncbi:DUF4372 domain-containing protein [Chryseobacterium gotjawalense]|uniref:DUF4372 domain-containing protein n=1 Tax=Chryseobacterium gotjawalense TaxID=3042315 RepID=A0ABY8RF26_9FLAO|nr:DUF4372 domain-containing protein [Chryseobacterium sp. wdc7]WHF51773.1 DUF4372 domain-containing protein [Chryseobacterium sp. wdc7]
MFPLWFPHAIPNSIKIIKRRETNQHNKGFNSWNHLVAVLFCQFAKRQSVRDSSNGLRSSAGNLNH